MEKLVSEPLSLYTAHKDQGFSANSITGVSDNVEGQQTAPDTVELGLDLPRLTVVTDLDSFQRWLA